MADDNNARYRSNDPLGRGPTAAPASDPLAELARLIGRNDPFGEYAREPNPVAPPPAQPDYGSIPAPQYEEPAPQYREPPPQYTEPAPQYSEPAPHYNDPPPQYGQDYGQQAPAAQHYAADFPPRYAGDPAPALDWPGLPAPPPGYAPSHPLPPQAPPLSAQHYDNQGYARPNSYADPHARPGMDSYADRPNFGVPGFAAAPAPDRPGYAPPLYPHEPEAGAMPPPHDDEFYDDEPRGGRRKGLLTVVAVLGLAVIGTAGAFGYRSIFGNAGSSGPPPIIRASGEPSKVAPPPATADTSASKFSYDRFGDAGKDEQVVRREEKPVDLAKVAPPPRTVFPGAPVVNSPPARSATTATANPPSAIGEPRRVRTVPIRPEQGGDVSAAPPAQQPMTVAPPRQADAAATAPADEPPAPRAAAPKPSARAALRSAPPVAAAPVPAGNAPLSLSPDANSNSLPPPPAQETFSPPPRAAAPPTRVASAPASGGGSYLVQVSSQKSEADAQSAYRGIQSKYPGVLGSHPHTVRRADLGAKGVYYRAMVGPFGSREEAVQLCSSLKQAGGDCVVQH
jgi:sporulation related protein